MRDINFDITGQVPSKKNNKRILKNSRTGNRFIANSEKFNNWHEAAMKEICLSSKVCKFRNMKWEGPLEVMMVFYNKDRIRHDLDNMASSILDLLVDAGYLGDDCCGIVNRLIISFGGVDRKNPRVEVTITELAE
jgi:hypothetical protein|nr:MAG TPA: Endodeoxyribonuclease RusA [Caudoviricetes sp.]